MVTQDLDRSSTSGELKVVNGRRSLVQHACAEGAMSSTQAMVWACRTHRMARCHLPETVVYSDAVSTPQQEVQLQATHTG